ncbi:hypothetical protein F5Y05DRAFT_74679 [Hypoxylon sp. FL0543]|nr:hypothetical protein F5Y05DRAFT_74679 [Hypoxylon sp. FL0543]
MVAWSTRCASCRQKRIKCDQQWPTCGQCLKSKQPCPGPPDRVKFVGENAAKGSQQTAFIDRSEPRRYPLIPVWGELTISPSMPGTRETRVGSELVSLLTSQATTFGFSSFAQLMRNMPAMLSSSPALTGAVSCLSDARRRQSTFPKPEIKLDPKLYGSALRDLRHALQDSYQLERIETLLATLVMWRVEATIATTAELPYLIVTWSVHLSGVGHLLELLGPEAARDELVFRVVLESLSELASHFYARNETFFFASPQWQRVLTIRDSPDIDKLLLKVLSQMTVFPDLMKDLRRYRVGQANYQSLHSRVKSMFKILESVEEPLQIILDDPILVRKRATSSLLPPVEEIYDTEDDAVPRTCCLHALSSICTNNMLYSLDGDATGELERRNYFLSKRTWMFHEQATKVGSFGMHYYPTALLLTYSSATSRDLEEWIVDMLNLLQERNPATDIMWTREEVSQRCYATSGNLWPSRQNMRPMTKFPHLDIAAKS